jgi:hypothetical protein
MSSNCLKKFWDKRLLCGMRNREWTPMKANGIGISAGVVGLRPFDGMMSAPVRTKVLRSARLNSRALAFIRG